MRMFIASVLLMGCLVSCQATKDFFGGNDLVVTTADNLAPGVGAATVPVEDLPAAVRDMIPAGTQVVVVNKDDLKDQNAPHIPLLGAWNDTAIGTAFDAVFHILSTFFPSLLGWEALLTLLFKRKREHYASAFKALVPLDKKVDLGGAITSVVAALGMKHSSPETEKVFEKEMEKK